MLNKLLKWLFNKQIVVIDYDSYPREIVRAYAYEIERELDATKMKPWDDVDIPTAVTAVVKTTQRLMSLCTAENTKPEAIRAVSSQLGICSMIVADRFGELLPRDKK